MPDGIIAIAIALKAVNYAMSLLCLGGPLFLTAFPNADSKIRKVAKDVAILCAVALPVLVALRIGVRSARISGTGLEGMLDPIMLQIVWESPLGSFAMLQVIGCGIILASIALRHSWLLMGLIGATIIASSFATIGHSLGEPRYLLAPLIVVHILAGAFWVASLAPLYRASHEANGVVVLHRFGVLAGLTVPVLVIVGLAFAWCMLGSLSPLFTTDYGVTLFAKLVLVAGLLSLAALNKFRLVPAMVQSAQGAGKKLRRSIAFEAITIGAILIVTAVLTGVTTPPVNL
ncbi:copper transporter [Rhodobacterales bacterium LSUCC0387]|nr:copper transporter [Rhodobacterales bacterium LSUCC0387]